MHVDDCAAGPDHLTLFRNLLSGYAMLDRTHVVHGLRVPDVSALTAASPELQADVLRVMHRGYDDMFASWLGRWVLTATPTAVDSLYGTTPRSLGLAERVRAENPVGKALAVELRRRRDELDILASIAEDAELPAHAFAAD